MADLTPVFTALRALFAVQAPALQVKADDDTQLYLDTPHRQSNKKPLFFGAVQRKKAFVSVHLMPVYTHPDLLAGLSPALKARMQGKSCFNFAAVDAALFAELDALIHAGMACYRAEGFVAP